ncbi:MAG: response regulator, partial [Treponema sp.]|nr:response regulator [Treponema sp.]
IGEGSKFFFTLTFDIVNVNDDELVDEKIELDEIEKPHFEGEILLCEDNVMNQQVIFEHLSRVGIKTIIAENGQIGVDLVMERINNNKKQFDLIFMDMHMPVMNGLEATSKIIDLKINTPVVAMTANIMSSDKKIYKMLGISDCIGKPFTSQELWRCLLKYFTPIKEARNQNTKQKSDDIELDEDFKVKLKLMFLNSNKNRFDEICKAIENDPEMAYRLVHSLKANAGQIGETGLQSIAFEVEKQLKNTNTVTPEHLVLLKIELEQVLDEISYFDKRN